MEDYQEIFDKLPQGLTLHDAADGTRFDGNEQFYDQFRIEASGLPRDIELFLVSESSKAFLAEEWIVDTLTISD